MANNIRKIDVKPGSKEFERMVFRLNRPVSNRNLLTLSYKGQNFNEVPGAKGIYVLPVYIHQDLNLIMLVTQLVAQDWIVAFTKATVKGKQVTDMNEPITTGEGLNLLAKHSPSEANNLLNYFSTLSDSGAGKWRLTTTVR